MEPTRRPAFILGSHSIEEKRVFRSVVAELGGVAVESVRDAIASLYRGEVAALVVGDALGARSTEELIRAARTVDPNLVVVNDGAFTAVTLRAALKSALERHDRIETPRDNADVLIVDDDVQLLRMMDRTLRGAGYRTSTSGTPVAALELLRSTRFSLVVLDVTMPGLTGLELAEQIRGGRFGETNRNVPLVFVTADDSAATYEGTFEVAAMQCLIKPFNIQRFGDIVESMIDRAA
jgi:CheY-like chemotaxis protein